MADAAVAAGFLLAGFLDDSPAACLATGSPAAPYLGRLSDLQALLKPGCGWIMALGDLALRRRTIDALARVPGTPPAVSVIHPTAFVSPSAGVGRGVYIGPQAVIHTRAALGEHGIINSGAIVEHDCVIGQNVHIAPGAVLGGGARVGAETLIGLGARVLPGISIGQGCLVGAGSVVLGDVPDGAAVVGVPAGPLRAGG